jgi:hypothetical protein
MSLKIVLERRKVLRKLQYLDSFGVLGEKVTTFSMAVHKQLIQNILAA